MMHGRSWGRRSRVAVACALAVSLGGLSLVAAGLPAPGAAGTNKDEQDSGLKAAFVFNFAKFTEWPGLPAGSPLSTCVAGDDGVASMLTQVVQGQNIGGRVLDVKVVGTNADWTGCQIVFVSGADRRRASRALTSVAGSPVLTISDGAGFATSGGIIELYVDEGKMAFAINQIAAQRAGLRLRSYLLEMASKIVRSGGVFK